MEGHHHLDLLLFAGTSLIGRFVYINDTSLPGD